MNNLQKNTEPSEKEFQALIAIIDFPIDNDYLDFMKKHDGAEGFLNNGDYMMLWRIDDIISINRFNKDLPDWYDYFFIGSDGSSLRYAFDKRDGSIISSDSYELGEVEPEQFGTSFTLFLDQLSQ